MTDTNNSRDEAIAKAIRLRDAGRIVEIFFESRTSAVINSGFKTETTLWDYKVDAPHLGKAHQNAWAHLAKDVLAFHNARGGAIWFGISNSFEVVGARPSLDSKLVNDQLRRYVPDTIWVEFHREFIKPDQSYVGLLIVPPRAGPLVRFVSDAPLVNGDRVFEAGWSAIRDNDSSRALNATDAEMLNRRVIKLNLGASHYVDEPFFRIPAPEYDSFVHREACKQIETALRDARTSVVQVTGIGGAGKTALSTWAVINAYESKAFSFIASCTAKDRELTSVGISALAPEFTSFESLLNAILDAMRFPDLKALPLFTKEEQVRTLIGGSNGLLFVDNLETVDDARIITFLDTLPVGVRAIVTSRRARVRFSVYPIVLGALTDHESVVFIRALGSQDQYSYIKALNERQLSAISDACSKIPLAIRWTLSRAKNAAEAIRESEALSSSGRQGEELLEFSFRRMFEQMNAGEQSVVQVLGLFSQAQPIEVLLVGTGLKNTDVEDALVNLIDDAIVQRTFDDARNDDCYSLLSITRTFVASEVGKQDGLEKHIRRRLSDYYEARDIQDESQRLVIRAVRQNADQGDMAMVDLGISALQRGDITSAEDLLRQAVARNPKNWKACKELAELYRHHFKKTGDALRYYEQAAMNGPKDARSKAMLFREWGLVLRDSGAADSIARAREKLETAYDLDNRDPITVYALAQQLERSGAYRKVVDICTPWMASANIKSKRLILPFLERSHSRLGNIIEADNVKRQIKSLPD